MKKYIFLLFNLIYLIGFSTDVKNITRRLSDKQIENINSVEDFFYYANGNKLLQFKGGHNNFEPFIIFSIIHNYIF